MPKFTVQWRIEVDATDPKAAAEAAIEIMFNPDFEASILDVRPADAAESTPWEEIETDHPGGLISPATAQRLLSEWGTKKVEPG